MNRIITILVTIFILLLLYIWISHVWGSDKPRHPRQIVDAKETQLSDEYTADADTSTYNSTPTQETTEEPLTNDEFATERPVEETQEAEPEEVKTEPVVEKKALNLKRQSLNQSLKKSVLRLKQNQSLQPLRLKRNQNLLLPNQRPLRLPLAASIWSLRAILPRRSMRNRGSRSSRSQGLMTLK
jgi:cytoskeletal protein RodZ